MVLRAIFYPLCEWLHDKLTLPCIIPTLISMERTVQILDCTIRDGSYVVDYQFTKEDTFVVAKGLAEAGIGHIEVGHGLGLNASSTKGRAAESDEDYIRAACEAAGSAAKIGSFFIPGIGREDDIRAAHDAGLGFIRLGIDVDDFTKLKPFVDLSKSLGLEVWGNMMKSYLVKPLEFGEIAKHVGDFGVDVVAIVDSAGGMTPADVAAYTTESRARTNVPLAFHGHDNLTLAVANCLSFVEAGGLYVDGSLAGLGRSGGNAATELLAVLLSRQNRLGRPVDWERLIEFADSVMQFCVPGHKRPRAAEIATGLNFFHTSFSRVVDQAVSDTGASLFRTLLRLPESSRKLVQPDVAHTSAQQALKSQPVSPAVPAAASDRLERTQPASLKDLADRLRVDRGKFAQPRVVTVAHLPGQSQPRIGPLRKNAGSIVAHVEVADGTAYGQVRSALTDVCELWLVDNDLAQTLTAEERLACYVYDDERIIAQALADAMQMLGVERAALIGENAARTDAIRSFVTLCDKSEPVDAIVACMANEPASPDDVSQIREGGVVFLLQAGALSEAGFQAARQRGMAIWRLDCGAALVAEVERILNTRERFQGGAGTRTLPSGQRVVAGGVVGDEGDIVVDHCQRPRFILGEADGRGGIRPLQADAGRAMQQWIIENWNL